MAEKLNPKDKASKSKVPFSYMPASVLAEAGLGMMEGGLKYGAFNWRKEKILSSEYYNALLRHITAWWEGEDIDPDSGLHHVTKAITTLLVLKDAINTGTAIDDRPPEARLGWQQSLSLATRQIQEKYPNPVPPYVRSSGKEGGPRKLEEPQEGLSLGYEICRGYDGPSSGGAGGAGTGVRE